MILYLVGMSCVGKTTIGRMLAEKIGYTFFDLDEAIEKYYKKPIERIQDDCSTMNQYRKNASVVLDHLLTSYKRSVIAGTPSGLMFSYLQIYKKHQPSGDLYSVYLKDSFENILERITFYDKDSNPVTKNLDEKQKKWYLKEIKADFNYFKDSFIRADFQMDIENVSLEKIPDIIIDELNKIRGIDDGKNLG